MRIIGSSKIDDYKKTVLEDSVLRAINAKPGDSVLFYKRQNDSSVCIYRAEGAQMSTENDAPSRNHMEDEYKKLRMTMMVSLVMAVATIGLIALNFSSLKMIWVIVMLLTGVLAVAGLAASFLIVNKVDAPYDTQSLVTVGGPYSRDRLTGIARMTSDGTVISGDLYINALFGANPAAVEAEIAVDGTANPVKAVVEMTKSVPGYSTYKVRFKESEGNPTGLVVTTTYNYLGKSIVAISSFKMQATGHEIKVLENGVEARVDFDKTFNSTEFDDVLYNPADDQ